MDTLQELYSLTVGQNCFDNACTTRLYENLADLLPEDVLAQNSCPRTSAQNDRKTQISDNAREELLLKLTTISRMFNLSRKENACQRLVEICLELVTNHQILARLIGCFLSRDQHVVYSACKAATTVLLSMQHNYYDKIESQLRDLFSDVSNSKWKAIYSMELLRQLLQQCHDNISSQSSLVKRPSCCTRQNEELTRSTDFIGEYCFEITENCLQQDWATVIPTFLPFWNEMKQYIPKTISDPEALGIFYNSFDDNREIGTEIHQDVTLCYQTFPKEEEQKFVAFLELLLKIVEWQNYHIENDNNCIRLHKTHIDHDGCYGNTAQETNFCKINPFEEIIQLLPHYLHFKNISSEIWMKILELSAVVLNKKSSSFRKAASVSDADLFALGCGSSFLSVLDCCAMDNIPCPSFEGFGGTTVVANEVCSAAKPSHVIMRKLSVLMVKAMLGILNSAFQSEEYTPQVTRCLHHWFSKLHAVARACEEEPRSYVHESVVQLFAEQDDEMIEMMLLLLQLYKLLISKVDITAQDTVLLNSLNPHLFFLAFLDSVHFDHSVLLDFLISSETLFLTYLVEYLHFSIDNWSELHTIADTYSTNTGAELTELEEHLQENKRETFHIHLDHENDENTESQGRTVLNHVDSSAQTRAMDDEGKLSVCLNSGLASIMLAYSDSDDDDDDDYIDGNADDGDDDGIDGNDASSGGIDNGHGDEDDDDDDGNDIDGNDASTGGTCSAIIGINDGDGVDDNDDDDGDVSNNDDDGDNDDGDDDGNASSSCGTSSVIDDDVIKSIVHKNDIISETYCESNTTSDLHHSPSPTLDKVMTSFIRLRLATERLDGAGLFPYRAGPLLRLMEKMEDMYDQC